MTFDYSKLPEFWQWVVGVSAIVAALVVLGGAGRTMFRAVSSLVKIANAYTDPKVLKVINDLPQFMITTAHSLADQDEKIERIDKQTHENGGGSLKDAVVRVESGMNANTIKLGVMVANQRRIEKGVKGLYDRVDKSDATVTAMQLAAAVDRANIAAAQNELETTRPPRKRAS